jgi:pimeloyl-ACP methyl ester carboxylesterase
VKIDAGPGARIARSRGYSISYEDTGRGSPVVVIPGVMQSAGDYRQAGYSARLAATHRVLLVDPLGHGQSEKPYETDAYRAPDVAADVIATMDAAGLEQATLWGYSRGAWLALMAAIEFPHRVAALILGGEDLTKPPQTKVPSWNENLARGDWAAFWAVFPVPLPLEIRRHFEDINDPRALAAERVGRIESAYRFDLGKVSAPVLIYCGDDDDPADVLAFAQAMGTDLHLVEGCDHFGAFNAVDRVMPFVAPFLAAEKGTPSRKGRRRGAD